MALQIWLPLDGNLNNQGLMETTVSNNGVTVDNNGKIGKCYYFDGNGHYLQLSASVGNLYSGDFSWAVWLKPTDSTRSIISSEYSSTGSSNVAFELSASRGVRIYWNGSPDIYPSNSTLPIDTWTHVAITKTTGIIKTYLNGVLRHTYTGTLSDRPSTSYIRIGDDYRGGTSVSYMGYMNDWRLYNHCLSPKEVHEISKGLVLHYPLDNNEDAGEGNIVYDCSGYGHHGMWYGNKSTSTDTTRYSKCTYLDNGQATYIQSNDGCGNPSDAITMNIWFKSSNKTPGSDYHHMFNGLTSWVYIEMAVHKDGYLRCGLYINGTRYVANCGSGILDGKWHMLTMTYDGANIKRYVDGVLLNTQAATGAIDRPNDKFIFGHGTSTGYYCKEAYLSDARIYATALSAVDILELYKTAAVVDNKGNLFAYELKELHGNELAHGVLAPNHATVTYVNGEYTVAANQVDSSWGQGFVINSSSDNRIWIPWGATYRLTMEVWTPTAGTFVIDYNNYPEDSSSAGLTGNDHDTTSTRLPNSISVPANTWTRLTFGTTNSNTTATTGNPNQKRMYDASNFGFNTRNGALTYKVRNISYVILGSDKNILNKTGVLTGRAFNESNLTDQVSIREKEHMIEATSFIEI